MYWKQVWNKSQTYFDGRFNSGAFFIYLTVRPSTDGKRAPLTAINLQAAGSPQQAPPTYIAKMWKLIKFIKNVIFWRNHTDINPDDWTITKKTIRTTIHENFSKMKNSKVDRWALSLTHWLWDTLWTYYSLSKWKWISTEQYRASTGMWNPRRVKNSLLSLDSTVPECPDPSGIMIGQYSEVPAVLDLNFWYYLSCQTGGYAVHLSPTMPYLLKIVYFIEWSQGDKRLSLLSRSIMYI